MVKNEPATHLRRTKRALVRLIPLGIIGVLMVVGFVTYRRVVAPLPYRQTVVIVSDPVRVVSFDAKRRRVTTLDIPLETVIAGAFGYGKYAMRAIISLDAIDHFEGQLILHSISNALGLPIRGWIVASEVSGGNMNIAVLRRVFSFQKLFLPIIDRSRMSITLGQWIQLVLSALSLSADAVRVVDLVPAMVETTQPDGSTTSVLDENRVDYLLGDTFFDADLRAENISVAVYNTTKVPAVGQRASRMLSRVGIQLVFVGNSEGQMRECVMTGSQDAKVSKTALFIRQNFDCDTRKEGSSGGIETASDLEVFLGTDFADRYY